MRQSNVVRRAQLGESYITLFCLQGEDLTPFNSHQVKPDDIPRFRVSSVHSRSNASPTAIDEMLVEGTFSHLDGVRAGQVRLYLSPTETVAGTLEILDDAAHFGILAIAATASDSRIAADAVFPWIDGIWVPRQVAAIADKERRWTRAKFTSRDATRYKLSPGSTLPRDAEESEATLLPGGWDHEHCELCWHTLGSGGSQTGFVDENDNWVCGECFEHFVSTHSIGSR